ncbi:MAG TPA: glycerate kinase [Drouetiella sp.]
MARVGKAEVVLKVLVSPCAYKGTLSAWELCVAIAEGIRDALPDAEIIPAPIADGGDGTLDALYGAIYGRLGETAQNLESRKPGEDGFAFVDVRGPIDNPVHAKWLRLGDSAVVELASASGLALMPGQQLSALDAHTFGLGQVILDALSSNPKNLYICVGGSASTDGGAGMLAALGAKFLDKDGNAVGLGGGRLCAVESCDLSALETLLQQSKLDSIKVAVDVVNPLNGDNGAAAIFGPQKGASAEDVRTLDGCLSHYAGVLEQATQRNCRHLPGSGAAGGTAFGAATAMRAELISGFSWLAFIMNLEAKVQDCDLVITAEGSLDSQSISGKAIGELSKLCAKHNKPLWAVPAVAQMDLDWQALGVHRVEPTAVNGKPANALSVRNTVRSLCC